MTATATRQRRGRRDLRDLTDIEIRPYLRVSRADKADKQAATMEAERSTSTQRRIFTDYTDREQARPGREYCDPDISASRFKARPGETDFDAMARLRPAFARMVADIRRGDLDGKGLWFWEISRQQRMLSVFAGLRDLCRAHGVFWVIRDRVADPANPADMLPLGFQTLMAEGETEHLSDRVYDGKESAAMNGRRAGRIPYGYRKGDYDPATDTFGPDQADTGGPGGGPAAVVAEVYDRLDRGESLTRIRRDLNDRGIRTRAGYPWYNQTLRNLALNPAYARLRVRHRDSRANLAEAILRDVKGQWPALVEEDQFWRVYNLLTDPARTTTTVTGRPRHSEHLLSALATCANCGGKLIRRGPRAGGHPREQYFCREGSCVGIDKQTLDAFVGDRIVAWLSDPAVALQLQSTSDSEEGRAASAAAEEARAELEQLRRAAEAGKVSVATVLRLEPALVDRVEQAEARLAEAATASPVLSRVTLGAQARAGWDALDVSVQRRIVAEVAAVEIHPVGRGHGTGGRDGGRGPVNPVYRVGWTWKLGPGKGTHIPPLSWAEHREEAAEWTAEQRRRRDYVSAERREKLAAILREDPEAPDRQIAGRMGRVDRHQIRRVRHELEQAGEIPVIRRPDRWHMINLGYVTDQGGKA